MKPPGPTRRISGLLTIFLLATALMIPLVAATSEPVQAQPTTGTFGNPWKDVTVENTADYVMVDDTSFRFYFYTSYTTIKDKNDVMVVGDERWVLEYWKGNKWKERGEPYKVEWERIDNGRVRVTRFYTDHKGTNFRLTYDICGGFRTKLTVHGENVQADNYRLVWRASGINRSLLKENEHYVGVYNEGEGAVVFDYSDVYQNLGDITSINTTEWASGKKKKIDLEFTIGYVETELWLDPNFGYETKGFSTVYAGANEITGSWFTCPAAGTADSITVYLKQHSFNYPNMKCAIYKKSDWSLVGYTEEWKVTSGWDGWRTFNIISGGALEPGVDYWLVWWGDADVSVYYGAEAGKGFYRPWTYNSFQDPLTYPNWEDRKYSIYCTYTIAAVAPSPDYHSKGVDYLHRGVADVENEPEFFCLWRADILGTYDEFSGPIAVGNKVWIANKGDCIFRCLELETGSLIWSYQLNTTTDAPPVWYDNKVYVATGGVGAENGDLYAFNADNGDLLWRKNGTDVGYGAGPWINSDDGYVYWKDFRHLRCLDADSGDEIWSEDTGQAGPFLGVYYNGITYTPGLIRAYDAKNGDFLWSIDGGVWDSGITVDNENADNVVLYVGQSGYRIARVWAVNPDNGDVYWSVNLHQNPDAGIQSGIYGVPAVWENKVYVTGRSWSGGSITCLNKENGDIIWEEEVGGPHAYTSPTILPSGKVVYASLDGLLKVRDANTGELLWSYSIGKSYCGQVAIVNNYMLVGSDSGYLWCFGGTPEWAEVEVWTNYFEITGWGTVEVWTDYFYHEIPADVEVLLALLSLGVIVGLGMIGFNVSKGTDPVPGLFMMSAGVLFTWWIGWLPAWILITVIALIAVLGAVLWGKIFRGGD